MFYKLFIYMFKSFESNLKKLSLILLLLLPVSLLTGPAIPDISITLIGILFLINTFIKKDFKWLFEKWVIFGFIFWISIMFASLFAIDIGNSFQNAFIFLRYIIFSIAVSYWLLIEKKLFILFLKILTITLIFIILDCVYQFINYNSLEGFGKDIFGFSSTHYGRLSGPFDDDIPGSHISRFIFFSIFLFLIHKKNLFLNNFSLILFISFAIFIIWLSGEAMAIATTIMGIIIYLLLIKEKKVMILIGTLTSILLIFLTNNFHSMNKDYEIISSTPYHHGLLINKFGECKNIKNTSCSKIIKTNPKFDEVINNFSESIYYKIYLDAFMMWKDNLLTGVGLNNYKKACLENKKYRSIKINYEKCSAHPHNIYIQFLSETGLIGLFTFIIFILSILFKLLINFSRYTNKISFINFSIIFWPLMSTGSLLKNWYGIEVFLVIGLLIALSNLNLMNAKSEF